MLLSYGTPPPKLVTEQFIQFSFLPCIIANWNNLPADAATTPSLRSSDRGSPLIHIASFKLSTFPLLKLYYYTHTIIFSFFSHMLLLFSYVHHFSKCTHTHARTHVRMHTHTPNLLAMERGLTELDSYPAEEVCRSLLIILPMN